MTTLKTIIEQAYKKINTINPETIDESSKTAILAAIELLDKGKLRVA